MMRYLGYLVLLLSANSAYASQKVYAIAELQSSPHLELVNYALQVTEAEYGKVELTFVEPMTQGRVEQLVKAGEVLQLAVFAPNPLRETKLLPVYFPLSLGLLGYRVCLITPEQQTKFSAINTLEDWRNADLLIGQGANWPDVDILKANNLLVTVNPLPFLLFDMLKQQRFDCYARSINEVAYELRLPEAAGLVVENNLLLYYPQPAMLFVSPTEPALAERLQKGLEQAWQTGFIHTHFAKHYGAVISQLACERRKILELKNPLLTAKVQQLMQQYAPEPSQLLSKDLDNCPAPASATR